MENQLTYGALAACTDRRDPLVINGVRYVADPDPKPPTLREQVALALAEYVPGRTWDEHADAVLAVVADWLAAQPVTLARASKDDPSPSPEHVQRDHDVRLIRSGGTDG